MIESVNGVIIIIMNIMCFDAFGDLTEYMLEPLSRCSFICDIKGVHIGKHRYIQNITCESILGSVFVGVQKWMFRPLLSLRYLNSAGINLNWVRTYLREKEKQ